MRLIPLTQGKFAVVDDFDYKALGVHKWYAVRFKHGYYAVREVARKRIWMHKVLLPGAPRVDHRDGNGLNNQRENLRPATRSENARGARGKKTGTTSKYRGVYYSRAPRLANRWIAQYSKNRKANRVGNYSTEREAAEAYDRAAWIQFGEFAQLNFPLDACRESWHCE